MAEADVPRSEGQDTQTVRATMLGAIQDWAMSKYFKRLRKYCKRWYDLDLDSHLCQKHPQYRGLNPPKGGCETCTQLYRLVELIKED